MTVKHTLVSLDMRVFALCSLMELHRAETAGARIKGLYPLCAGKGRRHIWSGTDDGFVQYCAGAYFHHYDRRRVRRSGSDCSAR